MPTSEIAPKTSVNSLQVCKFLRSAVVSSVDIVDKALLPVSYKFHFCSSHTFFMVDDCNAFTDLLSNSEPFVGSLPLYKQSNRNASK